MLATVSPSCDHAHENPSPGFSNPRRRRQSSTFTRRQLTTVGGEARQYPRPEPKPPINIATFYRNRSAKM
jgi:hypothetical protein